ncbi:MAG: hypothetical protein DIU52_005940 [bacterium]|jgi:hypothetical protein
MKPLGLPLPMFLVFAIVILGGSLGLIHYLIVHVLLRRPFGDEVPGTLPRFAIRGERPTTEPSEGGSR